jgi:hypothetical protein
VDAAGGAEGRLTCVDLFPTLANVVGTTIPADRPIDGVNQSDFFQGKTEKSAREAILIWIIGPLKMIAEFEESKKKYPLIAMGTPNAYRPPQ